MGEHSKHKKFSFGWVIGGTAIMFLTNLFGGFVAGAGDITGMWTIVGIALASSSTTPWNNVNNVMGSVR